MQYTVLLLFPALLFAVISINFLISAIRLHFGSNAAYEMNRSISASPRDAIFGKTKKVDFDGDRRVMCGMAFAMKNGSATYIKQSKITEESLGEANLN